MIANTRPTLLRAGESDASSDSDFADPGLGSDDLGLELDDGEIEESIFKEDDQSHYREHSAPKPRVENSFLQMNALDKQNEQLRHDLARKQRELELVQQELADSISLAQLEGRIAAVDPAFDDLHDVKIVELARKCRRLSIALVRERASGAKMHNKLKEIEVRGGPQKTLNKAHESDESVVSLQKEIRLHKDKFAKQTIKLENERTQNHILKQEKAGLVKLVLHEVGPDLTADAISKMIADGVTAASTKGGGWRSRSQQITMLKDKIKALTLEVVKMKAENGNTSCASSSGSPPDTPATAAAADYNAQHRSTIQRMQSDRRLAMERAVGTLETTRHELAALKERHEGALARNKILDKECKSFKQKCAALLTKSNHDDELIEILKKTLEEMRGKVVDTKRHHGLPRAGNRSAEFVSTASQTHGSLVRDDTRIGGAGVASMNAKKMGGGLQSESELVQTYQYENDKLHAIKADLSKRLRQAEMRIFEMEKTVNHAREQPQTESSHWHIGTSSQEIQRLRSKLEIAKDENNSLKAILQRSLEEKDAEIQMYASLLKKTRDVAGRAK